MRKVLYHMIQEAQSVVPAERIFPFGSVDTTPQTPFIVYKLSGRFSNLTSRRATGPVRVEVWVHDTPGSYTRIEEVLDKVEDRFLLALHEEVGGDRISQIDYDSRSPDLDDTGFRTICKMSSFITIGRG